MFSMPCQQLALLPCPPTGLKLVFNDPSSDVMLLEVVGGFPSSYGMHGLGLLVTNDPPQDVVIFHHPLGLVTMVAMSGGAGG